jgi:NAD(P)-dependent dehydrogenase (short-subunit alcohol dehydrogenase family)
MDIHGARVVISGGGRGIGAALARSFAASGAKVVVVARTQAEVELVAQEVGGTAVIADVRHSADCERVARIAQEAMGGVDILVNNAGVAINQPLHKTSEETYDAIMDTNVKGVFLLTQAVLALHPKIIVSLSSGAHKAGYPGLSVYCASKFAVRGLMESLVQETHAKVYTVLPGGTDTRLYQELFDERARIRPEQIADAIVALCQEEPPSGKELELLTF